MRDRLLAILALSVAYCTALADNAVPHCEYRCLVHDDYRRTCFTLEIADEPEERNFGLMMRELLAPRHGMLFDFEQTQTIGMWMKNTLIPLDMVFLDEQRRVVFVHRHAEPHSLDIISPPMPVRYTLELNAGDIDRYGLRRGDLLLPRSGSK